MDDVEILRHLRVAVLVVDPSGTIVETRGAARGFLGYHREHFIGRNCLDFVAPQDLDRAVNVLSGGVNDSTSRVYADPIPVHLIDRDGNNVLVDLLATRVERDGELCWVLSLAGPEDRSLSTLTLEQYARGAKPEQLAEFVAQRLTRTSEGIRFLVFDLLGRNGRFDYVGDRATAPALTAAIRDSLASESVIWDTEHADGGHQLAFDDLPRGVRQAATEAGFERCGFSSISFGPRSVGMVLFESHADELSANVQMVIAECMNILGNALAQSVAEEMLRDAAERDPLTGLANRACFETSLKSAADLDVAVLYLDLDEFKQINDLHGHAVGDQVLVEVASRIESVCRPGDVVARLGGDEFAVLLPGATADEAQAIGERMVSSVRGPAPAHLGDFDVSASIGLAVGAPTAGLVEAADLAMLRGKRQQRGKLTSAR